jgi:ATP-dependent 26S proteasome regulatory subunit
VAPEEMKEASGSIAQKQDLRLPPWAIEMKRKYEAGESAVFLLYGNVLDILPYRSEFVHLRDFLTRALSGGKDIVAYYNISEGITFATPQMKEDFRRFVDVTASVSGRIPGLSDPAFYGEHPELIRDPQVALPLLERLIEMRNRVFLVIDHVDKIAPNSEYSFMNMEDRRSLTTLLRWAAHPQLLNRDNVVILVAKNLADVHRELRGNPLVELVEISYPDRDERLEFIAAQAAQGVPLEMPAEKLANGTAGLNRISINSFFQQARKTGEPVSLAMVKRRKTEILTEEYGGLVEVIEPDFGLEMVGGLDMVKEDLKVVIELLREGNRTEAPMGVGLIGPPGTGKTMLAKAVAKGSDLPFLKIGDIRDKWVGESEKNADRVITLLRSLAPVVVFVDEIDQAFGSRGERGDSGVSQRIWAKFSEIQSDTSYRGKILWIWATNRPDIVDEATKRPGRLGDLKIPFFFAADDPEAVIRLSAKRNNIALKAQDLSEVLELVKGYSAAELEAVVLRSRWFARRAGRRNVTLDDLIAAAKDYIPSRNDKMIEYMELLAVLEASSMRMLPEKYKQNYDRDSIVAQAHKLRLELSSMGLL